MIVTSLNNIVVTLYLFPGPEEFRSKQNESKSVNTKVHSKVNVHLKVPTFRLSVTWSRYVRDGRILDCQATPFNSYVFQGTSPDLLQEILVGRTLIETERP